MVQTRLIVVWSSTGPRAFPFQLISAAVPRSTPSAKPAIFSHRETRQAACGQNFSRPRTARKKMAVRPDPERAAHPPVGSGGPSAAESRSGGRPAESSIAEGRRRFAWNPPAPAGPVGGAAEPRGALRAWSSWILTCLCTPPARSFAHQTQPAPASRSRRLPEVGVQPSACPQQPERWTPTGTVTARGCPSRQTPHRPGRSRKPSVTFRVHVLSFANSPGRLGDEHEHPASVRPSNVPSSGRHLLSRGRCARLPSGVCPTPSG